MTEQPPLYNIGPFRSSSKNTDTQLNVYVSNKQFTIDLFTANFESSSVLLAEYLQRVQRLDPEYIPNNTDEDEECEDPLDQMHDWILQPFLPIFRKLAPLDQSQKYTLEDCLFAEEFHYTVQAMKESLVPVFLNSFKVKKNHLIGAHLPSSTCVDYSMFPVYNLNEIQVSIDANSTSLPAVPRKVFIHGRPNLSFFKIVYRGDAGITMRKLLAYSKIHTAKFNATVRTSRLDGLVKNDNGYVMGLLLSYIDSCGTTLYCIDGRDPNGDAYLIDFGGGYTRDWVEKEMVNSIDGDLQGLENIKRHLLE
ncbi:hypothetical protein AJ78_05995 [Emergomyces pasteurianus Ep9510]|uniref:Uncharacterized protein n=1 Tax=Emergomyces pasteurianus Ep9510 TaxID=1447872 RepID=A0A1J9QBM9_9EURO|nr:hypothetical protein AJ78_05995 [Emergomyces pasteurianus Ep9510]